MEYSAVFIAIHLVEDAYVEHPVVDNEEKHRPLDERHIESFDAFLDKGGLVVEIFRGEKIASGDEEEGHVKLEDEPAQPSRCFGMRYHHQDDGDTLSNRYCRIPLHFSFLTARV